jgi:hypothetical protein
MGNLRDVVAMLRKMLGEDRRKAGWSMGQAAWPLGVSVRELAGGRGVERVPSWEVWDRICKLYGWPQTFVGTSPVSDGRKRPIIGLHGIPPSVGVRVHGRPLGQLRRHLNG